ncbi:MAG: ATP-binding protein [Thaumarchaeota archaeon]|nr:ATP-binding protein [Nitrososphaerota archaeon]
MSKLPDWVFDSMEGVFEARLRRVMTSERTSRGEGREITVSNTVAIVEAKFSYKALDRLNYPSFIGIERVVDGTTSYVVFEVVSISPTHYQMLGMDVSMPTLLRKEYLDTINESWGKSQETWIDLHAIPTWYITGTDGLELDFQRTRYLPLTGARAFLLSKKAVERFLCYDGGQNIGTMIGFGLQLTVDMDNLIRYHTGIFGFTGTGKSNLTSSLLRTAVNSDPELTVVIFDVAGEYSINLLDLLISSGRVITAENIEDSEQFYNSQTVPESLEQAVGLPKLRKALGAVFDQGRISRLSLREAGGLDLAWIQQLLDKTVADGRAGGTTALIALETLSESFYEERGLQPATRISDLDSQAKEELAKLLREIHEKVHEKSGLRIEVEQILDQLQAGASEDRGRLTPEKLAYELASGRSRKLNIMYLPEPTVARMAAARLVDRLLYLRKKMGSKNRLLIVLDEAQEYIPDNPTDRLFTVASNNAVEKLLRQGRKYRVHCWLATQRVAHLNVSALQQLHSYFVSTLPRMYDRMVVADSFALPYEILERSAQLETGEWIFVSFKASKQKNVPVFVKTENNEDRIASYLKTAS